jgi:hypothetical protein
VCTLSKSRPRFLPRVFSFRCLFSSDLAAYPKLDRAHSNMATNLNCVYPPPLPSEFTTVRVRVRVRWCVCG